MESGFRGLGRPSGYRASATAFTAIFVAAAVLLSAVTYLSTHRAGAVFAREGSRAHFLAVSGPLNNSTDGTGNRTGNSSGSGPPPNVLALTIIATPVAGFAPVDAYLQATLGGSWFGPPPRGEAPFNLTICPLPGRCDQVYNWSGTGAYTFYYLYTVAGMYNITGSVTGQNNSSAVGHVEITVAAPIFDLLVAPSTGGVPLTVNLTGEILGGASPYNMTICPLPSTCFTNASVNSSGLWRVSFTYLKFGSYTATAVVTDAVGAQGAATAPVLVERLLGLVAHATQTASQGSDPLTATFRADVSGGSPPYTLQWEFGDGTSGSAVNGGATTHTYHGAGVYAPSLTVRDAAGHASVQRLSAITVSAAGPVDPSVVVPIPSDSAALVAAGVISGAFVGLIGLSLHRYRVRRATEESSQFVYHLTQDDIDPEILNRVR